MVVVPVKIIIITEKGKGRLHETPNKKRKQSNTSGVTHFTICISILWMQKLTQSKQFYPVSWYSFFDTVK